jgi:hypothetical protein
VLLVIRHPGDPRHHRAEPDATPEPDEKSETYSRTHLGTGRDHASRGGYERQDDADGRAQRDSPSIPGVSCHWSPATP